MPIDFNQVSDCAVKPLRVKEELTKATTDEHKVSIYTDSTTCKEFTSLHVVMETAVLGVCGPAALEQAIIAD